MKKAWYLFWLVGATIPPEALAAEPGWVDVRGLPQQGATVRLERADGLVVVASCEETTCLVTTPPGVWSAQAFHGANLIGDSPQDLEVAPRRTTVCWMVLFD